MKGLNQNKYFPFLYFQIKTCACRKNASGQVISFIFHTHTQTCVSTYIFFLIWIFKFFKFIPVNYIVTNVRGLLVFPDLILINYFD